MYTHCHIFADLRSYMYTHVKIVLVYTCIQNLYMYVETWKYTQPRVNSIHVWQLFLKMFSPHLLPTRKICSKHFTLRIKLRYTAYRKIGKPCYLKTAFYTALADRWWTSHSLRSIWQRRILKLHPSQIDLKKCTVFGQVPPTNFACKLKQEAEGAIKNFQQSLHLKVASTACQLTVFHSHISTIRDATEALPPNLPRIIFLLCESPICHLNYWTSPWRRVTLLTNTYMLFVCIHYKQ